MVANEGPLQGNPDHTTNTARREQMGRIYDVGGKKISLEDAEAVRALTTDELADLLTQTQSTPPELGDTGPVFPEQQPPAGTAFILLPPPAAAQD